MDDKHSFGYLYYFLASEVNREAKCVVLPCVPNDEKIKYAIKFDIDEVRKEIDAIKLNENRLLEEVEGL